MAHLYKFVALSTEITDPKGAGLDAIKPIVENFEESLHQLRLSIHSFEQWDQRYYEIS